MSPQPSPRRYIQSIGYVAGGKSIGRFPYTCESCGQSFTDGVRRNQKVCKAQKCDAVRNNIDLRRHRQNKADAENGAVLTTAKVEEWWAARQGEYERHYYFGGLTPEQVKKQEAKNAARLAELREDLKRMGAKI